MRNSVKWLLCFLIVAGTASAGEKKPAMLTGNSSVDFFGPPSLVHEWTSRGDSTLPIMTTEVEGEKSPWIAGFLSLAVPGAGEYYTHSYVKAGAFFAAEIASAVLAIDYNKKGDDQTAWFEQYADEHYDPSRYAKWTQDNASVLNPAVNGNNYTPVDSTKPDRPPFDNVDWDELHRLERDISSSSLSTGYTHQMPVHGQQQYYELIGKYLQFSAGWDDADLSPLAAGPVNDRSAGRRVYYATERALANHYYDISQTYVSVLVVNHLLSAIDAYWSATRYNSSLHADLQIKMRSSPYGLVPVPVASFRYDF